MKNIRFVLIYGIMTCLVAGIIPSAVAQTTEMNTLIPLDPRIKTGKLPNGLTYFIMQNKRPEKRAELRLAVNVGSSQEDDDQQGLAHFVEHMAFNGTSNFKKNELVDYLERSGIKFGPDLNAYTNFDETIYMLTLPTDSSDIFDKGFLVLEDWAHGLLFDSAEVAKERGVVGEEWRLGKGADERMRTKYFPLLFKDSRYAVRLPIGKKEVIDTASVATLKRFYNDWYRPDLMAVIAIGDFDVAQVEAKIIRHFSSLTNPKTARKVNQYPVPDHTETIIAKATDKEAPFTLVNIIQKLPVEKYVTQHDYRRMLAQQLYNKMLSERLKELSTQPDPPFSFSFCIYGELVRTKNSFSMIAFIKDKNIERATTVMLTEAERVKRFGFTATELTRQKESLLREAESAFMEKDSKESGWMAYDFTAYYLQGQPLPGPAYHYDFCKQHLGGISLEEVNNIAKSWVTPGKNLVIVVTAPEKEGLDIPSDAALLSSVDKVHNSKIEAYQDEVISTPLITKAPLPGKVVAEKKLEQSGITEWTLSNGVLVVLKPTTFKKDEIIVYGFSWGGSSRYSNDEFLSVNNCGGIVEESGAGSFDELHLNKYLQGKILWSYSNVSDYEEFLGGQSSNKDLESLMQLHYLAFTSPGNDTNGFAAYISKTQSFIENQGARPEKVFDDSIRVAMSQYHKRREPMNISKLNEINAEVAYRAYKERFSGADDFTFLFVGSFTPDSIKPLVEKYIASLPVTHQREQWKDTGIRLARGNINKTVYKGSEPKSRASLQFTGDYQWSAANNITADALMELIRIKLREKLREEKGGTYGVSCSMTKNRIPAGEYNIVISFGCAPENVESLMTDALHEIELVKKNGVSADELNKVKELMKRQRETDLQENWNWASKLMESYKYNDDPAEIFAFDKLLTEVTASGLTQTAGKLFNNDNYSRFVLMPAK